MQNIDLALIEACKNAQPEAQRRLYEWYLPYVLTIARRFGFSDQQMPDVLQEIFIEIFVNIKKYDAKLGAFKYWLKSIAIHKMLNLRRQQQGKHKVDLETIHHQDLISEIDWQKLDAEFLIRLIGELPEGCRTVFNLHVVDGYSHREISAMLDIDPASSRSQLSRAREMLRKKLNQLKQGNCYGLI